MASRIDLVVARYTEDVRWIDDLAAISPRVWLYNKGGTLPGRPALPLDNIGREAHTYLIHIVDRWDDLGERTVFCQGHPHDHCPGFIDDVLLWAINPHASPDRWFGVRRRDGVELLDCDRTGKPHHPGLPIAEYCELYQIDAPDTLRFAPGACFAASRETIRSRPKSQYVEMLRDFTARPGRYQPWVLERLWGVLFRLESAFVQR